MLKHFETHRFTIKNAVRGFCFSGLRLKNGDQVKLFSGVVPDIIQITICQEKRAIGDDQMEKRSIPFAIFSPSLKGAFAALADDAQPAAFIPDHALEKIILFLCRQKSEYVICGT